MCTAAVIAIITAWVIINRYSILCVCRRCDRGIPNTRFVFIHTQRPYSDQFISNIIACTGCAGEELVAHLIRCIRGTVCSGWTLRARRFPGYTESDIVTRSFAFLLSLQFLK